ncbi:MAG: PAS domain S-box protein [Polaromonas sp.]|nr:PAS domain S-box protein [Archangium sp.]MDP3750989.1 PAS domain S-box protein [Polaromonas sp.]
MKATFSLRARIVLLLAVAIVPLFGMSIYTAWHNANAALERAKSELQFVASLVAANQQSVGDSARQVLTALVQSPWVVAGDLADCRRYLTKLNAELPMYTNLGVIGSDGLLRCDGLGNAAGGYAGDRDYFQAARSTGRVAVSGYMRGRNSGKHIITFAMPLVQPGTAAGVAFVTVDLTEVARALANAPLPGGRNFVVTDRKGIVLVSSADASAVVGQPVSVPLLQQAVTSMQTGIGEGPDTQGRQRLFAFRPAGAAGQAFSFVAVSVDRDAAVGAVRKQLGMELTLIALVAFLGSWLAWRMGGQAIVGPTEEILHATRQIQEGRYDARIPALALEGGGELSRVAAGFNLMAESLQKQQAALQAELDSSDAVKRKLQDAQRLGRIGYWQLDVHTSQSWWSDEAYDVLGVDRSSFDGNYTSFVQLVHADDRQGFAAARAAAVEAGLPLDTEFRVTTDAGEVRWIHLFGRAHDQDEDDPGPVKRRAGVIQDITERKKAELAVARNTELLNRTGEMAKIGGWELLLDRMVYVCSDEVYRIHEVPPVRYTPLEQAIGFYAPEAQPLVRAALQAGIDHGQPCDLILPLVTANGRRRLVHLQGRALQEDGKTVRLVGALQDVTEQQEAQSQLKLLEAAVSRLNDIVLITEAEPVEEPGPRIVFVNDAFERRTGYSREEVLGKSPRFLQGPKTQPDELDRIGAALRKWQPVRGELINYTKSGQEFWLELDIVPIADASGWFTHWVAVERDITQRKHAEQALVDSEQRYAALFGAAPVPMWVIDAENHRFLAVNRAAIVSYGYSLDEFLTMTIFDIRSELEAQRLRGEIASGFRQVISRRLHRRKNGHEFHVGTVSNPLQYSGRPARFVVALDMTAQVLAEKGVRDHLFTLQRAADATQAITRHRTLEAALQETVEQVRAVVGAHQAAVSLTLPGEQRRVISATSHSDKYAHCRDMVRLIHASGLDAMASTAASPMRLTQPELQAHPLWVGLNEGDDKAPAMRGWLAVPLTGHNGETMGLLQVSDKYEGEFTLQDQYVSVELAQLACIAIENAQLFEQVQQLNLSLEQKVAERTAALARQEAMSRVLAEQAPQVVWNADTEGRVTYANRKWYELMGGEPADWMGNKWLAAIHPDDLTDMVANWEAARASLQPYHGMRRFLAQDGTYHTMSYRATPVLDEQGSVLFWVGIDADVTEIKAVESALRLSNQELEAFSYSVSHDLRSPLNTVDGFSRLLAKQLGADQSDEKTRHYLSRIQAGVGQMGRLIEDLLSLAQVSRMQLRHETVSLSALAHEIADECRGRDPERVASIHIEDGLQAQGDGRLLRVVMENLLGNAWKFTSQLAHAEIHVGHTIDAAGLMVFLVRDNGAGFDMAYADKLFNTFQRLHAVTEFPGTGVGLATVSRVISRHGGQVWAESAPDQGATFFFTLPGAVVLLDS